MLDGWERLIPCEDTAGRRRDLKVFITQEGKVALHAPPGEVAVLLPGSLDQVKAYLTSAQLEAVQLRGEW